MKSYDRFNPKPIVRIAGSTVADCVDPESSAPVVIDDISIPWGRDNYLDMPEPATMTVRLLDRAGTWVDPANRHPVGTRIELLADDGDGDQWHVFRGRIASVGLTAGPTDPRTRAPSRWIVEITATDLTAVLGNITFPEGTVWPAESAISRANRLRDAGLDTDIEAVYFAPDAVDWQMNETDVSDQSLLELIGQFYRSLGTTWAYNPQDNTLRDMLRLRSGGMRTMLSNWTSRHRLYAGNTRYLGADGESDPATIDYQGIGLEGCRAIAESDTVDLAPNLDINRLECQWRDYGSGNTGTEVMSYYDLPDREPWDAVRVFQWDSWLSDGLQIDPVLSEWAWRIMWEGNLPRHPEITLDAREMFTSTAETRVLLRAGETPSAIYLMGSKFTEVCRHGSLPDKTVPPPTYSAIGGEITYRDGWLVTLRLQTWWTDNEDAGTVSWSDIEPIGTEWGFGGQPPDVVPNRFNDSITWQDMAAVTDVEVL